MFKMSIATSTLIALSARNSYNPVAAAAQNSHNEILKQTVSPEGTPLPESMTSLPLRFSKISKSHAFVFLMQ